VKPQFLTPVLILFAGLLPAADSQLVSMVMPEAKVMTGINVDSAKASPFGQFVLSQMGTEAAGFQKLLDNTGFDPRKDVREVIFASTALQPTAKAQLVLARGSFDVARIAAAAVAGGGTTETYNGATLVTSSGKPGSVAFADSTLAVAGLTNAVKAALDRRGAKPSFDAALLAKVNLWSAQDAWMVSIVPPSSLHPQVPDPNMQGVFNGQVFQKVQQSSGGVKFGSNVAVSAEAIMPTSQDAAALADVLRFLANMVQSSAQNNPGVSALQSLVVNAQANTVSASLSIPENVLESLASRARGRAGVRHRQ
jgi:hypothetical protein